MTAINLAAALVRAKRAKGYSVFIGPGEVNIDFIEGLDYDGKANANRTNEWQDLCVAYSFQNGAPVLRGAWEATTQPGRYYTENPLHDTGAANIALGQQTAWVIGQHRGKYEALVQHGAAIVYTRDQNKDYKRTGDKTYKGSIGVNIHHGHDAPTSDIGANSAGCLVLRSVAGFGQFLKIVKSDPRYLANRNFIFTATVLLAADVLSGTAKAIPPPIAPPIVRDSQRLRMSKAILDFEARRDSEGRLAVYKLPSGDGGGAYEVAGINDRYHPAQAAKLKSMIEAGQHDEAEKSATEYLAAYTDGAASWSPDPGVQFFLRDCAFNRGPTGAARILQRALGEAESGTIGPSTRAAVLKYPVPELLLLLRSARESYERKPVGRNEKSKFWAGLVNRWNHSYETAHRFHTEGRGQIVETSITVGTGGAAVVAGVTWWEWLAAHPFVTGAIVAAVVMVIVFAISYIRQARK